MNTRRFLKLPHIICAALATGVPCLAKAYDDDTHFVFTFLAARASGYSPIQASRIASACVEIVLPTRTQNQWEEYLTT